MTNEDKNLNELKRKLFKNLAEKVKTISANQEKVIFARETDFGATRIYFEYSFKDNTINQMYKNSSKCRKRFFYDK